MKHKSFLFLIAALAMGLALFGCSTDSDDGGSTTITIKQGYASDADAIMAAFKFADDVYLSKQTDLKNGTVVIDNGKTLHVDGYTIKVDATTAIVTVGTGKLDWDNKATSKIEGTGAVLVGITIGENDEAHYSGEPADYVLLSADGDFVANAANNGGYLAALDSDTASMGKVFGGGTYVNAVGGTTAYLIGNYSATSLKIDGGTLVVTGNLGSSTGKVETIDTDTPLSIYGDLFGGTVATASTADIIKSAGTVTVYKDVTIDSGAITNQLVLKGDGDFGTVSVAGTLDVTGNATFAGKATFTAPLNVNPGKADFGGDAEFSAPLNVVGGADFSGDAEFDGGKIGQTAKFASGKTVSGKVEVNTLGFSGSNTTNTLILSAAGEIIYTGGVKGSILTDTNGVGTLAALDGAGDLTFSFASTELGVSGAGSFVVNKAISLTGDNKIKVDGTTGVYFNGVGSIAGETYELGNKAGTLSDENGDVGGFILTKDGITKLVNTGSASLSYELEDKADAFFLTIKEGGMATLTGVNISASGGSISFSDNAMLHLAAGGSVTAGNIAWGGTIAGTEATGGGLLVGSLSAATSEGAITAAAVTEGSVSVSETVGNFILSSNVFYPTKATVANGLDGAAANVGDDLDGGSAAAGGSILIFGH